MTILSPIIFGYGHCGRNLHHVCLRKLQHSSAIPTLDDRVNIVDPVISIRSSEAIVIHDKLMRSDDFTVSSAVIHICTPPSMHLEHVRDALRAGYRYIILEKPMVMSKAEAHELLDLQQTYDAHILVVAVWAYSSVVEHIQKAIIASGCRILGVDVVHNKPRFTRSLQREGEHVFDVELPHQLSLAMLLLGESLSVVEAGTRSLHVGDEVRPSMKSGYIVLESNNSQAVCLTSDLTSPIRERRFSVTLSSDAVYHGYLPVSSDDSYSQFEVHDACGRRSDLRPLEDDPLTNCLKAYYRYFSACAKGETPPLPPGSSIQFNQRIVDLLEQARIEAASERQFSKSLTDGRYEDGGKKAS